MLFDCCLYLSWLDANIALCYGGATMLQEMLHKSDIIAAVAVDLCGVEFAETMCANGGDLDV